MESFDANESEDDNNSGVVMHEEDADYDNDSMDLNGGVANTSSDCGLEREAFDDFVTRGIPDAFWGYFSNDSFIAGCEDEVEYFFHIPTTDAGDLTFEIEQTYDIAQTRGMSFSGHIIRNFVDTLLTRQRHQLKTSSIHKYFFYKG